MSAPTQREMLQSILSTLESLEARVGTLESSPAQASAEAPAQAVADNGKVCVCGHEHKRPVRTADRHRLATETACQVKGCVSHPDCHA
jgi:hypothetical protein